MIPAAFAYDRPATLDEAIGLLSGTSDVKVLAGGQSLLPLLKLRLAGAERLIDIGRIRELRGVRATPDGGTVIGALLILLGGIIYVSGAPFPGTLVAAGGFGFILKYRIFPARRDHSQ